MDANTHAVILLVLGILTGGPAVNLVGQLLKKVLGWFGVDSDAVIHTMIVALSALAGGLQYIVLFKNYFPPEVLGASWSGIYGWSQTLFKYTRYANGYLERVYTSQHIPTTTNPAPFADGIPETLAVQTANSSLL